MKSIFYQKIFRKNLLTTLLTNHYPKQYLRTKTRHQNTMDLSTLIPESRGMTILDREKFRKTIKIPTIEVDDNHINKVLPHLKEKLLKLNNFKPVQSINNGGLKRVHLHPNIVKDNDDLPNELKNLKITGATELSWANVELTYDNWKAEDLLKAILPINEEGLSSYSRIGHIIHVNLRDHLLPYKHLIGEIIQEKNIGCRTVVNKLHNIENTYRVFELELLHGDSDYDVLVKENGINFQFDFSKVYWNPRLASEHERIVKLMHPNDVLYDIFSGVGPFSIPIGKRKCFAYANDLNPESYRWLNHNVMKNKLTKFVKTFNKDGRDFIATDVRNDLLTRWQQKSIDYNIHITMNLPSIAVEFLPTFYGLFDETDLPVKPNSYPIVHVYCFAKGLDKNGNETTAIIARKLVQSYLDETYDGNLDVHFVRNVAPNKDMYRVTFSLTEKILFAKNSKTLKRKGSANDYDQSIEMDKEKKLCVTDDDK